jgi:hypothetical protein
MDSDWLAAGWRRALDRGDRARWASTRPRCRTGSAATASGRAVPPLMRPAGAAREDLETLVEAGLSVPQIARRLERSATTVRYLAPSLWPADPARSLCAARWGAGHELMRDCRTHGWTWFRLIGIATRYRCARCAVEALSNRRLRMSGSPWRRPAADASPPGTTPASPCCSSITSTRRASGSTSAARRHPIARPRAIAGSEVRPPVRELPRRARSRVSGASRNIGSRLPRVYPG